MSTSGKTKGPRAQYNETPVPKGLSNGIFFWGGGGLVWSSCRKYSKLTII